MSTTRMAVAAVALAAMANLFGSSCAFRGATDDSVLAAIPLGDVLYPTGWAAAGGVVYIRDAGSLTMVDVDDPATPVLRTWVSYPNHGGALVGAHGWLLSGSQILDLTDPMSPRAAAVIPVPAPGDGSEPSLTGAFVVGDRIYGVGGGVFLVIDVSDPADPAIIGSVADPTAPEPDPGTSTPSTWNPWVVGVAGSTAYTFSGRLVSFDLSDETRPQVGTVYDEAQSFHPCALREGRIYGWGEKGVLYRLWEVDSESAPQELVACRAPGPAVGANCIPYGDSVVVFAQSTLSSRLCQLWYVDASDQLHPGIPRRLDPGFAMIREGIVVGAHVFGLGQEYILLGQDLFFSIALP